jgi:hypothetical protein
MLLADLFSWWYGAGWAHVWQHMTKRIAGTLEAFSVGLLLQTLFSPFRQISASKVTGSLDTEMRAWLDLQLSRLIGAMVRSVVIMAGLVATLALFIFTVVAMVVWPLVPIIPILTLVIAVGLSR